MKSSLTMTMIVCTVLLLSSVMTINPIQAEEHNTLIIAGHTGTARTFMNLAGYDVSAQYVQANIYNGLLAMAGDRSTIKYDLAESVDVSDDAKTYTLHLVSNAKWHDGVPFTSADVKFTLEGIIENEFGHASALKGVASIETPDDHTVKITLRESDSTFTGKLASHPILFIIPKHIYEGTDWTENPAQRQPIGTGPFKFVENVEGSHVTLVAYDEYHGGRPAVDTLVFRETSDASQVSILLERGDVDYSIIPAPPGEIGRLAEVPHLSLQTGGLPYGALIGFQIGEGPTADPMVRRAIILAIDRDEILRKVFRGFGGVSDSPVDYRSFGWARNPDVVLPAYDPDEAERLLDEAGYKEGSDGKRFSIPISTFKGFWDKVPPVIKEQLSVVGIEVDVQILDIGTLQPKLESGDFQGAYVYAGYGQADPGVAWEIQYALGGRFNFPEYNNPRVNELFKLGAQTSDQEQRKQYYYEIQTILSEDTPSVLLTTSMNPHIYNNKWTGFFFQPDIEMTVNWQRFEKVRLVTEPAADPVDAVTDNTTIIILVGAAAAIIVVALVFRKKIPILRKAS